jgi:hypothetical protein
MEPDEVDILPRAVFRNLEKIDDAEETGLSRQTRSYIQETDRLNRIHFNFTFFHLVSVAGFDMSAFPDSNAARDFPTSHSLPKTLREDHDTSVHALAPCPFASN